MVVSSVNTTGIFESTDVSLLCTVTVTPLDVESVVNITWFGPNGMITMNDTLYGIDSGMINSMVYGSFLNFTTSFSDNATEYYCVASFGPADDVMRSELIIPVTATSNNVAVSVDSKYSLNWANLTHFFFSHYSCTLTNGFSSSCWYSSQK